MSLFGAMNTAISGLSAQSSAFGNISDNVANSQTVGYKRVDTSFIDYLTTSTASNNVPGAVVTRPDYVNNVEGTITQTDNQLALAITGQGFFAVSKQAGVASNLPTFESQQEYTRAGDFQMDKNGYLVNSAGLFLNGWPVANGVVNQNTLTPIQVSQTVFNPVATANVNISANLPATPTAGTATALAPISSNIDVYDALGTMHSVTLNWQLNPADPVGPPVVPANNWTVNVSVPDDAAFTGSANVTFGTGAGGGLPAGTVSAVDSATGNVGVSAVYNPLNPAAQPAFLTLNANFGSGAQPITVNLGNYGGTSGVTQYAGTDYNLRGLTQDGVPPGAFSSVSTATNGDIAVNYDNGQSRVIARVPVVTFNDPNGLQRQDGQAFTVSQYSGGPLAETASTNGAGDILTQSVENSNVDIATEFSKLIVAQRAYTANTKIVTSADDMLQQTIDMKR
jgi:flagellar hook protein FlgE